MWARHAASVRAGTGYTWVSKLPFFEAGMGAGSVRLQTFGLASETAGMWRTQAVAWRRTLVFL